MAGTLTHNKFAHDIYDNLKSLDLDKDYFIIGNQGHDLIEFIRIYEYPFKGIIFKSVYELQMVDLNVFKNSISKVSKEAKSFLYGYISHELLDRKVHPYIDLVSNYDHKKHAMLESVIDIKINDINNIDKYLPKKINLSETFKKEISEVFLNYFHKAKYSKRILKNVNNVTHFLKFYRFDKTGIKKVFYSIMGVKYLSFHYSQNELDVNIDEFLKLYNEAKNEITSFLKNI